MVNKTHTADKHGNKSRFRREVESLIFLLLVAFAIRTVIFGLYKLPPSGSMETTLLDGEGVLSDKLSYWFRAPRRGEVVAINAPQAEYQYSKNPLINWWQRYVWGPSNWTKRVIGLPGDHIKGVVEDGKTAIYLNGQKLDEPYVNKYPLIVMRMHGRPKLRSFDKDAPLDKQPFYRLSTDILVHDDKGERILVEPGTPQNKDVFDIHLGPNEYWLMGDNRLNSKDSRYFGPVDGNLIHGRIIFRLFSVDSDENWMIVDLLKHPIDFFRRIRWSKCLQFVS